MHSINLIHERNNMQTKNIYDEIKQNIKETKNILLNNKDEKNSEVNQNALAIFTSFEKENSKELEELAKNQEWDSFTIAFYGETNAGKSTLIEALRIYFKEESKQKQELEFDKIYSNYEEGFESVDELQAKIEELQTQLKTLEPKIQEIDKKGFFFKFLMFFGFHKNEKSIKKEVSNIQKEIKNLNKQKEKIEKSRQNILDKLLKFQDGAIIGDGRSDFTRSITAYNFLYNNEKFTLLDVPGIEGNEKIVIDEINNATRKAHAIFYIKKEPTPPQKGEEGKKGTLEKIKDQLNAQTEVYTIFNKPITSPRALEKELVNENEKESLKVLDEKMQQILGKEHYAGHKELSAQIAFYAVSSHLAPQTELFEKRQKFIEKFNKETLLEKSNFNAFVKFLGSEIIANSKAKIKKSNFNKALVVVNNFIHEIQTTIEKMLKPFLKDIKAAKEDACDNLDISAENFITDLLDSAEKQVDKTKSKILTEMYDYIETDVKDKEFKEKFERVVEYQIANLGDNIKQVSKEVEKEFVEKIKRDVKQYKSRIQGAAANMAEVEISNDFGQKLEINIDSGINKWGVIGSLVGVGAAMFWNPGGWVILTLGILASLLSFAKAIIKFFSSSYRKSQQRKAVDDNLREISKKLKEDIEKQLEENEDKIKQPIENIKLELDQPIKNTQNTIESLNQIAAKLQILANSIKKEIQ